MRRRSQDKEADPAFLDEKTARKQAERQVLLDALNGNLEAEAIEWTASNPARKACVPSDVHEAISQGEAPDMNASTNSHPAGNELRDIQHLVQQKLGLVMLRMQQFEHLLKAAIVDSDLIHTTAVQGDQHQQKRIEEFKTKSLGLLVEEATKTVLQTPASSKAPKELRDENQAIFRVRSGFDLPPEKLEQFTTELKNIVSMRNLLVHHLIEKFDLSNIAGCQAAVRYIEESYAVVGQMHAKLAEMLEGSLKARQLFSALLQTPEMIEFLTTGRVPTGDIHVSA